MTQSVGHHNSWVKILGTLMSGPVSLSDIVNRTRIDYETIRPLMNELKKADLVHIMGWRQDSRGRWAIAVYQLGLGIDVKKPKPKTGAKRMQERAHRKAMSEEDVLFKPIGKPLVTNNVIDNALRGWI